MRYSRTHEWIALMRRLWTEPVVDHHGAFYECKGARLEPKPHPAIPVYLGGHSEAAQKLAAELADVYLVWADTLDGIRARLASMREAEAAVGRRVPHGMRCHVIVRETETEAWAAADRLISRIDPSVRAAFVEAASRTDSEGQRRQVALSTGTSLVVEENLWAGVGLARTGVGLAIVGNPEQVAAKLRAYQAVGVSTFILSGYPHLEECRRFGELVMPLLRTPSAMPVAARAEFARSEGVAPVT
jgi:alkanesulfonate monooxygenase